MLTRGWETVALDRSAWRSSTKCGVGYSRTFLTVRCPPHVSATRRPAIDL